MFGYIAQSVHVKCPGTFINILLCSLLSNAQSRLILYLLPGRKGGNTDIAHDTWLSGTFLQFPSTIYLTPAMSLFTVLHYS